MSSSSTISSHRPVSRDYDTGFPESLAASTTSWRHPEANTAPDACISADDIDPAKALRRHRRSFLHHKYKRTTSHGFITTDMEQEYLASKDALDSADSAIDLDYGSGFAAEDELRPSKDGSESIDHADGSLRGGLSQISPMSGQFQQSPESPRRRSGLFRRMISQKH
ncbi:hypothetical protein BX600DRAFT_509793 [Xylariales sp. PMI_506]|nr:hypothetical protein BX600DRAFT_509793 [Xylariales sp. PMI_506]